MNKERISTSKFLSLVLRHRPDIIGVTLDAEGWIDVARCGNGSPSGRAPRPAGRPGDRGGADVRRWLPVLSPREQRLADRIGASRLHSHPGGGRRVSVL